MSLETPPPDPLCCATDSWPPLPDDDKTDEAQGETISVDSAAAVGTLSAYYVEPKQQGDASSTKGIVLLGDVYGRTSRMEGICDYFAAKGNYHVIMPDCFRGETIADSKVPFAEWLNKFPFDNHVGEDLDACMKFLASKGITSVGGIGFCWGGWALTKASSCGIGLLCGTSPHPSIKIESLIFQNSQEDMASKVQIPVLLMPAGNDPDNVKPGGTVTKILESKGGKVLPFPDMVHGWVTRGDYGNADVKRDAEIALSVALEFFGKHL